MPGSRKRGPWLRGHPNDRSRRQRLNPTLQNELVGACKECNAIRIRSLLQTGHHALDVNQLDKDGYPPIVYCVVSDSVACLEALATEPALDLAGLDELKDSTLHHGVVHGAAAVLRKLLSMGLSPNIPNASGNTPLHTAILNNKAEFVAMLVRDKRVDIDAKNRNLLTPLALAVSENNAMLCRLLIRGGANPLEPCGHERFTPTHLACALGYADTLAAVTEGWSASQFNRALDGIGRTPLHVAVLEGRKKVVRVLLEDGADPYVVDGQGFNALDCAIHQDRPETLKMLLASGSRDALQSAATLLHTAAKVGQTGTVRYLLQQGLPATRVDDHGDTPLHAAVASGTLSTVEVLLEACKAVLDVANQGGYTALHLAIAGTDQAIPKLLLDSGADASIPTADGTMPASLAIQLNRKEAFELLAQKAPETLAATDTTGSTALHHMSAHVGANFALDRLLAAANQDAINARNNDGVSPLLIACSAGNTEAAQRLIAAGADTTHATSDGHTALHFAAAGGYTQLADALLCHGAPVNRLTDVHRTPLDVAYSSRAGPCAECLLTNGGRTGQLLQQQAALTVQTAWRSFTTLRRRAQTAEIPREDMRVMLQYTLRCQLSVIRKHFRQQAWRHHNALVKRWTGCSVLLAPNATGSDPSAETSASGPAAEISVKEHSRSQRRSPTWRANADATAHTVNASTPRGRARRRSAKASAKRTGRGAVTSKTRRKAGQTDGTSGKLPPIHHAGHNQSQRSQVSETPMLSAAATSLGGWDATATAREAEQRVLSKLRDKLADQELALQSLKQENHLLKSISKTQEKVLMKVHGVDMRLSNADKEASPTKTGDDFGAPPQPLTAPSAKLDLELKRQQRLIRNFKQRFDKLQSTLSKSEEAAAPLPPKVGPEMDEEAYARRAQQKLLRKQMQSALQEIVKLRSDTESLSQLMQRKATTAQHTDKHTTASTTAPISLKQGPSNKH